MVILVFHIPSWRACQWRSCPPRGSHPLRRSGSCRWRGSGSPSRRFPRTSCWGDLDGDGGLVLLEGVLGPLDGGGEVLSAGQLGRLADPPRAPLEVHNSQLLAVEDNTPLVASGGDGEGLELRAVALHLQLASHLVHDGGIDCLPVDVVEEPWEEV